MSTSIIFKSCSSGLLGKLRSSGVWGVPRNRRGASFPGRPGWVASFLSVCPLLSRVRLACFFLLGCWCTTRLRPLPRAPRTGLLWTAGLPGLEEGRAEWLTTSKFCFSVGLGWGIFPCLKISSPPF